MKIALTGPSGLIGSRFFDLLKDQHECIPIHQQTADITNRQQIREVLNSIKYDVLIHLAAYTNVDGAETARELAYKINVEGTRNIVDANNEKGGKLIYISTDFVFDGTQPPYTEGSQPNPLSIYGKTKYEGEKLVKELGMIVRLSYPFRKEYALKNDFVHSVIHQLKTGNTLRMVEDSLITPTFVDDIVYNVAQLCENFSKRIVHVVGADSMSPYAAGILVANTFGLDAELIKPISYADYFKNKAPRPQYSDMKTNENLYVMKTFSEGLKSII